MQDLSLLVHLQKLAHRSYTLGCPVAPIIGNWSKQSSLKWTTSSTMILEELPVTGDHQATVEFESLSVATGLWPAHDAALNGDVSVDGEGRECLPSPAAPRCG
jgi:hypothetical protein